MAFCRHMAYHSKLSIVSPELHVPKGIIHYFFYYGVDVSRKFFELYTANDSPMFFEVLQRIGNLYVIEEGKNLTIEARL